jgi:hypothetical protein
MKKFYRYENAGLTNKKEAAIRMLNGEKFYIQQQNSTQLIILFELGFDERFVDPDGNPFRCNDGHSDIGVIVGSDWSNYKNWLVRIEVDWKESIHNNENGILCFVNGKSTSLTFTNRKDYADYAQDLVGCVVDLKIDNYNNSLYILDDGRIFLQATPMTEEEIKKYLFKL